MTTNISLSAHEKDGLLRGAEQSAKGQIDGLIASGIVSHRIKSKEALDPLFAVSQLHALPEIRFVAAFQEGQIYLGCPSGPPAKLVDLVETVSSQGTNSAASPEICSKIDALIESVSALRSETEDRIASGLKRIDRVSHRLEFIADALEPGQTAQTPPEESSTSADQTDVNALVEMIKTLHKTATENQEYGSVLDRIETSISSATLRFDERGEALNSSFETIRSGIDQITDKISSDEANSADKLDTPSSAIEQSLVEIQASIAQLSDSASTLGTGIADIQSKGPETLTTLATVSEAIKRLNERNEKTVDSDEAAMLEALRAGVETLSQIAEKTTSPALEAIQSGLDEVLQKVSTTTENSKTTITLLEGIAADKRISELAENVNVLVDNSAKIGTQNDLSLQMASISDGLRSHSEALNQSKQTEIIEELRSDFKRLANQPKPVLDLTEQNQSFASFVTTMSSIAKKIETTVEHIDVQVTTPKEAVKTQHILDRIDTLPAKIQAGIPPAADLSEIETRMEALRLHMQASDAPHIALSSRLDALVAVAKSEIDGMKSQVVSLSNQIEASKPQPIDLAPILIRLDGLAAETTALPETVESLRTDIQSLAARPPLAPDLTAQQQSFARFGITTGTIVTRLEETVDALTSAQKEKDSNTVELTAIMQSLPSILQQTVTKNMVSDPLRSAVTRLQEHLTPIPDQLAELASVRDTLEDFVRRPAPILDVTEQRRGFAGFATAISMVVNRLEHVATQLSEMPSAGTEKHDTTALVNGLKDLTAHVVTFAEDQTQQVQALGRQINTLSGGIPISNDPQATPS